MIITQHDDQYDLFLNWFTCCQGADSTYDALRVGRSASIDGPFVDREGRPLLEGGALLFGAESGRQGPRHAGLYTHPQAGALYLTYHHYPDQDTPWATLGLRMLEQRQGWPQVIGEPQSLADALA